MRKNELYLIGIHHQDIDGIPRLEHVFEKTRPKIIALEMNSDREITFDPTQETFYAVKKLYFNLEKKLNELEEIFDNDEEIFRKNQAEAFDQRGFMLNKKQLANLMIINLLREYIKGYELYVVREYSKQNPSARIEYIDLPVFDNNCKGFVESYYFEKDIKIKVEKYGTNNKESQNEISLLNQSINDSLKPIRDEIHTIYAQLGKINEIFEAAKKEISKFDDNIYLKTIYNPKRDEYMIFQIQELYKNNHSGNIHVIVGLGHFLSLKKALKHLSPKAFTLAEYNSI